MVSAIRYSVPRNSMAISPASLMMMCPPLSILIACSVTRSEGNARGSFRPCCNISGENSSHVELLSSTASSWAKSVNFLAKNLSTYAWFEEMRALGAEKRTGEEKSFKICQAENSAPALVV